MRTLKTKLLDGHYAEPIDKLGNFARFLLRRFIDDRCFESAGSLSYTSILAAIPFAAVVFTVLTAFPSFDQWTLQLTNFVFMNFVPSVADNLEAAVLAFAESARTLPARGILALVVTVALTMWSVEQAFNRIWRVPSPKPRLLRFLIYWGLLMFGGLVLVLLMALNSALSVYFNLADYAPNFMVDIGLRFAPLIIELFGFTFAYWLIPHRAVPLRYAAIGGAIAMLLFELLKWLFALYLKTVSYEHIYGAMALVPITLVWLYSVWLVILLGASITATMSSFRYRPKAVRAAKDIDFYWILRVLARLIDAGAGKARLSNSAMAYLEPNISEGMLRSYFRGLAGIGMVQSDGHGNWWLSRPLSDFRLRDLHHGLGLHIPNESTQLPVQNDTIDDRVLPIIALLRSSLKTPLERPLSHCFEEAQP